MADETGKVAKLQFHYIKAPDYREIACHGVVGGIAPNQRIWMSFFSERPSIPRLVEYDVEISENSKSVQFNEQAAVPSNIEARPGVIRHVETTAYIDIEVARRLYKWLEERVAEIESGEKT